MFKALFIDKDGTLIEDDPYNVDPLRIRLYPEAGPALALLARHGYRIIVVSNQSGVARGFFQEQALRGVEITLRTKLSDAGVALSGFYYCPHHPNGTVNRYATDCQCRKPRPGLIFRAAEELGISLDRSWMAGDILNDVEAGNRAGCRTVLVNRQNETEWVSGRYRVPEHVAPDVLSAAEYIVARERAGA